MSPSTNPRIVFVFDAGGFESVMLFTRDQQERHLFMLAAELVTDEITRVSAKISNYLESVKHDGPTD
jgi:hypothetical protein